MLALLLASLGIYGVIAYSVSQRTREIGIRMALGAQTPDIVRMVVRHGLLLTLAGVTIGIACAFVLTRVLLTGVLSSFLYQVSVTETMIFIAIPLILMEWLWEPVSCLRVAPPRLIRWSRLV